MRIASREPVGVPYRQAAMHRRPLVSAIAALALLAVSVAACGVEAVIPPPARWSPWSCAAANAPRHRAG